MLRHIRIFMEEDAVAMIVSGKIIQALSLPNRSAETQDGLRVGTLLMRPGGGLGTILASFVL